MPCLQDALFNGWSLSGIPTAQWCTLSTPSQPISGKSSGRLIQNSQYKIVCSVLVRGRPLCGIIPFNFAPSPSPVAGMKLPSSRLSSGPESSHSPTDSDIRRHCRAGDHHLKVCSHLSISHCLWGRYGTCSTALSDFTRSSTRTHADQFQSSYQRGARKKNTFTVGKVVTCYKSVLCVRPVQRWVPSNWTHKSVL